MRKDEGGRGVWQVVRAGAAGVVGCLAVAGAARADVVTFDGANDLANNFTINNQTGTAATPGYPGYVAVSSGGVSNSGAVDVTGGPAGTLDATGVYNKRSFDLSAGTVTISQFVKVQAVTNTGDRLLQLGLIDDTTAGRQMNGGGAARADFVSARISPSAVSGATTGAFNYQVQSGQSDGTTGTTTTSPAASAAFNLTLGDWYLFTVNITRTATANTFSVDASLQDFGTDGVTAGSTMTFAAQQLNTNTSDLYGDASVYPAFRSFAAQGGADLLDTFSVTQAPEPGSLAVVGIGAGLLLGRRRRGR